MHRHAQGIEPGCRWCDLDLLLRELAGDVGLSNLMNYMNIEFGALIAEGRRLRIEQELREREELKARLDYLASPPTNELEITAECED